MTHYEYKVLPAPRHGQKGKGVKGAEARFSHALQGLMNTHAADGWEFQRAETLPSEERSGLTSSTTTYRNVLVFRRPLSESTPPFVPADLEEASEPPTDEPQPVEIYDKLYDVTEPDDPRTAPKAPE